MLREMKVLGAFLAALVPFAGCAGGPTPLPVRDRIYLCRARQTGADRSGVKSTRCSGPRALKDGKRTSGLFGSGGEGKPRTLPTGSIVFPFQGEASLSPFFSAGRASASL